MCTTYSAQGKNMKRIILTILVIVYIYTSPVNAIASVMRVDSDGIVNICPSFSVFSVPGNGVLNIAFTAGYSYSIYNDGGVNSIHDIPRSLFISNISTAPTHYSDADSAATLTNEFEGSLNVFVCRQLIPTPTPTPTSSMPTGCFDYTAQSVNIGGFGARWMIVMGSEFFASNIDNLGNSYSNSVVANGDYFGYTFQLLTGSGVRLVGIEASGFGNSTITFNTITLTTHTTQFFIDNLGSGDTNYVVRICSPALPTQTPTDTPTVTPVNTLIIVTSTPIPSSTATDTRTPTDTVTPTDTTTATNSPTVTNTSTTAPTPTTIPGCEPPFDVEPQCIAIGLQNTQIALQQTIAAQTPIAIPTAPPNDAEPTAPGYSAASGCGVNSSLQSQSGHAFITTACYDFGCPINFPWPTGTDQPFVMVCIKYIQFVKINVGIADVDLTAVIAGALALLVVGFVVRR